MTSDIGTTGSKTANIPATGVDPKIMNASQQQASDRFAALMDNPFRGPQMADGSRADDVTANALTIIAQINAGPNAVSTDEARDIISENFDVFDAGRDGETDGAITRYDLEAVLLNPNTTTEQKAAAAHLLADYAAFDDLAAAVSGRLDGGITEADIEGHAFAQMWEASLASHSATDNPSDAGETNSGGTDTTSAAQAIILEINAGPNAVSTDEAIDIISENFDVFDAGRDGETDGAITRYDLEAVLLNPNTTPEQKAAAAHLLADYAAFDDLAAANAAISGRPDGAITESDIEKYTAQKLAQAYQEWSDGATATTSSTQENNSGATDTTSAAQAIAEDINAGPNAVSTDKAISIIRADFEVFDADHNGDKDGAITRSDLETVLLNPGTTPEQKAAAAQLLADYEAFDDLDRSEMYNRLDGRITEDNISYYDTVQAMEAHIDMSLQANDEAAINSDLNPVTTLEAFDIIDENFDAFDSAATGENDGRIDRNDLIQIVTDDSATPDQQAAAAHLLDNPEAFDQLDATNESGEMDGAISRAEVDAATNVEVATVDEAAQILNDEFDAFDISGNGAVSRNELLAILRDDSATAEQKAVAVYLLGNPSAFSALDGAVRGETSDGSISREDLDAALMDS